jgi:hypothetical protein
MCGRLSTLIFFVLALGLFNVALAVDRTWTDGGSGHLWSTPDNWDESGEPTDEDDLTIYYNPASVGGPFIDSSVTAACNRLKTGYVVAEGDGTVLTITGGSLHVGSWFGHAEPEGSTATMIMSGGTVTFDRTMAIGQGEEDAEEVAYGVLYMTGGLIKILGEQDKDGLWVTVYPNTTGHIQLDGGRIETRQIFMLQRPGTTASIDITYGVLVVDGSPDTENWYGFSVQYLVNQGWITAFGGQREVVLEYDAGQDKTTVRAFMPEMASNPSPANFAENVCPDVTLSWTPGELCVDDHNVYFGTSLSDVNESATTYIARHDSNSFAPSLGLGKTYYWRIDEVNTGEVNSPWTGAIWQFTTNDGNAYDPSPPNGLRGVSPYTTLDWTPGCLAASHTLYLGTSYDDVNDGSGGTNKGSQDPGYDPDLESFTTYYWRVEEVNGPTTWPGKVWNFRTGYGGVLMYYKFDGTQGNDLPSPITDSTGKVTFTKYIDPCGPGSVRYGESNPVFNTDSGTSADFDPNVGLYRDDPCEPNGWDLLRLDGYQYTIEMWIKPESLEDGETMLFEKDDGWNIELDEDEAQISWTHAEEDLSSDADVIAEGEWTHVAAVYDQTDPSEERMKLYINGGLDDSDEETELNAADNNNPVVIGCDRTGPNSFGDYFDGLIDELRVQDIALTACDFLTVPGLEWASCPNPYNGQDDVDPCEVSLKLSWTPGIYADKHNIYFGTSLDDVNDSADPCVTNHDTNSWTPPTLELATIYYWRIDEVDNDPCAESPWVGVIWQFMTRYEIVDPNLLLWYKFDETSGDDVFDWSGHGLHGECDDMDDEDWEPNNGHIDGCLSFDGDGRVDVPRDTLGPIDKEITVSVWVNGGYNADDDNWVFSTGFPAVGDHVVEAAIPTEGGDVWWRAGNDSNDVLEWEEASPEGWRGEWHHFAFVKDEDANTMSIYFDGLEVGEKAGVSDKLAYARNREFKIGARFDEEDGYVGKIDDFRIYDYALSDDEIAELFRGTDLGSAWGPTPYDGQQDAAYDANLVWQPGDWVADTNGHDLYFGTDWDEVNDANTADHPNVEYHNLDVNSYDIPYLLELDETYYWRVDENNDACQPEPWTGKVWTFKVAEYIIIDDMEDYTEGFGSAYPITDDEDPYGWDSSYTNLTGANLFLSCVFCQWGQLYRSGDRAMYYFYDLTDDYGCGYFYAEISNHFELDPNDWTTFGVKMLTLWFYGEPGNANTGVEQMYVGLEDYDSDYAEVRYGDGEGEDVNDIAIKEWQPWNIPLNKFTNNNPSLNLTSVEKLCIGFGERYGSVPGGSGDVHLDDIRLYPPTCVPWLRKPDYDLNDDCIVDFGEVAIMEADWLEHDVNLGQVTEPCDANLVGWWEFDTGTGDTAYDSSDYLRHGTIEINDVNVWWVAGVNDVNYALEFDGGRVRVSDASHLRPTDQVSVSAWIKYSDEQDDSPARVVVKGADNKETYALKVSEDDRLEFEVRDGNDYDLDEDEYEDYDAESDEDTLDRDEWIHIAGTYDGNSLKCYINGELAKENHDANAIVFLCQDTNDLAIGGRSDENDRKFKGTIDDVRIYDYGLSAEEVAYLATDGGGIFTVQSIANLINDEPLGERSINLRDFDKLAGAWLEQKLYPQ